MKIKAWHKLKRAYKNKLGLRKVAPQKLDFFMDYLKFLRDYLLLTEPLQIDGVDNQKIIAVQQVLEQYDEYLVAAELVKSIAAASTDATELQGAKINKEIYWKNIWALIAQYGESWLN